MSPYQTITFGRYLSVSLPTLEVFDSEIRTRYVSIATDVERLLVLVLVTDVERLRNTHILGNYFLGECRIA